MNDLATLFAADREVLRWKAEGENASARLELARHRQAMAVLLSQHEPVASLGIDRETLRALFHFVQHGDEKRMRRELAELSTKEGTRHA